MSYASSACMCWCVGVFVCRSHICYYQRLFVSLGYFPFFCSLSQKKSFISCYASSIAIRVLFFFLSMQTKVSSAALHKSNAVSLLIGGMKKNERTTTTTKQQRKRFAPASVFGMRPVYVRLHRGTYVSPTFHTHSIHWIQQQQ